MHVQWQGTAKTTRNVSNNVAKCQERTATVGELRIQTVQETQ